MRTLRAIIVYNGGSAGDFLKAVCNQQVTKTRLHDITERGNIEFSDHHFKDLVQEIYKGHAVDLSSRPIQEIENTHYFVEELGSLCSTLVFIDYPDHLHDFMIDRMCSTRYLDDMSQLLKSATQYLPRSIKSKLRPSDAKSVMKIAYQRNLNLWRKNPALRAVAMGDLMRLDTLKNVVQMISGVTSIDQDLLAKSHQEWLDRNPLLLEKLL